MPNKYLIDANGKYLQTSDSSSSGETWIINESPSYTEFNVSINFTSNSTSFSRFRVTAGPDCDEIDYYGSSYTNVYCSDPSIEGRSTAWLNQAYRTVTFETTPTGTLLTWLQANAVKQGGSEKFLQVEDNSETWVINESPSTASATFATSFVSRENSYIAFAMRDSSIYSLGLAYVYNPDEYDDVYGIVAPPAKYGWIDESYRTVTFLTAPTGDLLTWLQANAVKQ